MAEVLPPLMQNSSTITMLHSRPSSADAFQSPPQQYQQAPRLVQTPRAMYNTHTASYRGTAGPAIQPYAFQSTPHLRQETRTISAPVVPHGPIGAHRHVPSPSTSSSDTASVPSAKDDSVMGSRPGSVINLSSQLPDLTFTPFDPPVMKSSPDRYRRPGQKRVDSNNSLRNSVLAQSGTAPASAPASNSVGSVPQPQPVSRQSSTDDMTASKAGSAELASRYRRRSLQGLEPQRTGAAQGTQRPASGQGQSTASAASTIPPVSHHSREKSCPPSRNNSDTSINTAEAVRLSENARPGADRAVATSIMVPPRASSDANRRLNNPSPLSRNTGESGPRPSSSSPSLHKPKTYAAAAQAGVTITSPAAAQLAAVSDKDLNKGKKSRLRRAFSFGSAQEMRRTAGENHQAAQHARVQHQQRVDEELDAEQMEIARRQEEAGFGAGIYSGQGGFTGSTDNLSISSTASSASLMLRKMGRGAKKGAKSIKGLFRPKSVIGVPAADGPLHQPSAAVQPSVAQVSMVTVEAERQKVNVNADPTEKAGGATGFPKLERNSIDAAIAANMGGSRGSADGSDSVSRRSIVGSDKDRAEVLAAVKKGILKRSGTASSGGSPRIRPADLGHTPLLQLSDSPASSAPGTPKDGPHPRGGSSGGDYFSQRLALVTKSMPNTPNGSSRGISFSPRIQFHDAWSATDYDRRGEIATCNRLTPLLAQQIKEELNTFKMEMEVHELSKTHTHFF